MYDLIHRIWWYAAEAMAKCQKSTNSQTDHFVYICLTKVCAQCAASRENGANCNWE